MGGVLQKGGGHGKRRATLADVHYMVGVLQKGGGHGKRRATLADVHDMVGQWTLVSERGHRAPPSVLHMSPNECGYVHVGANHANNQHGRSPGITSCCALLWK